jgi:hypothetical protein
MHWYGIQAVPLGLIVHTSAKLALALPGFPPHETAHSAAASWLMPPSTWSADGRAAGTFECWRE